MGSPPPNRCEILSTRWAMPRAAAPPCEPRQPFDQAGAETRKSRPLSSFFAIDSCFFSTSDAENSMVELHRWLSHQHLGVRNLYRPWAKDERACARCNASCGQQAVGVDHRSIDLKSFDEKTASRASHVGTAARHHGRGRRRDLACVRTADRHTEQARGACGTRLIGCRAIACGFLLAARGTHLRPFPSAENHISPVSNLRQVYPRDR